jgi:hypothetical protein
MDDIKWKGSFLKVSSSWNILKVVLNWMFSGLIPEAWSITEVGGFIHIKPDSIESNILLKFIKPIRPEDGGIFMSPINIDCIVSILLSSEWLLDFG